MPQRKPWRESEFRRYLKESPVADKAIDNLAGANCSRTELISLLRGACRPDRKQIFNNLVRELVPSKQRAREIAQSLERSATELRLFACSPLGAISLASFEVGEKLFRAEPEACNEAPVQGNEDKIGNPRLLADAMEQQAQTLRRWSNSPVAAIGSRGLSFRDSWKHVPIVLAARMVKRRNGKVPWGELALALEGVAAGYGVVVDVSPRALQKEHDRFVKSATGKRFDASGMMRLLLSMSFNSHLG